MDITKKWINSTSRGTVIEREEYTVGDQVYTVDGKHVKLIPSSKERKIANLLAEEYGKIVELVPKIEYPKGIQTPDYLVDGERFDLKTLTGKGKYLLEGAIKKKQRQSHNFIIDLSSCPLEMTEINRQVDNLYKSKRLGFLEKLVLIKDDEIIKVMGRK